MSQRVLGGAAAPGAGALAMPAGGGSMSRYKHIKLLGKGGFGAANLVSARNDPKKLFVVKEVRVNPADRKAMDDAKKEAAFLASLRHPNIVGYVESFMEKATLFIVMEFADGGDLHGRIQALKNGRMQMREDEAMDYFVQVRFRR